MNEIKSDPNTYKPCSLPKLDFSRETDGVDCDCMVDFTVVERLAEWTAVEQIK